MTDTFDRIVRVLQSDFTLPEGTEALISEVRSEIEAAVPVMADLRAKSVDPLTDMNTAQTQRRFMDELAFRIDRLTAALPRLEQVLERDKATINQEKQLAAYEQAAAKMEVAAKALDILWHQLAGEMKCLVTSSLEALIEVQAANARLPDGKAPIAVPGALLTIPATRESDPIKPLYATLNIPGFWKRDDSRLEPRSPAQMLELNR